jgi:hypothetical protein
MTDPARDATLQALLDPAIRHFIAANGQADVAMLALKGPPDSAWPFPLILDQIAARQKAARKLPGWLETEGVIFPAPGLIEQASSEATARYKASLVMGESFADLTAGSGVDSLALLHRFRHGIAVERDPHSAALLRHNLPLLGGAHCDIRQSAAEDALPHLPPCDLLYLDPQRRDAQKRGLFRFEDASPNVFALLPQMLAKAPAVLIKTSPVLDIDLAIRQLGSVVAVHVVEWQGDCREVLYLLNRAAPTPEAIPITAAVIDDHGQPLHRFSFTRAAEAEAPAAYGPPQRYLYEPSPALMKAGGFRSLSVHFGLAKLHPHTHLYTGDRLEPDFPGRVFEIHGLYQAGGKDLPLRQASVTVRNFPLSAETLRKKLKLADGGDDTLFACTLLDGRKALIHARRVCA